MDYQQARNYLLSLPEATEDFPFGPDVAVFRVRKKMFGLLGMDKGYPLLNLKCDPEHALFLRDFWPAVIPGYHMNKKHWNSVILDGSIPADEIERMIDHSWEMVVAGLPKMERSGLPPVRDTHIE